MNFISKHASDRSQQRGIPPLIMEWLFEFGMEEHHRGRQIVYFDKRSRRSLRRAVGRQVITKLDKYMNCYLVVDDGMVITVGHRFARIPRS